MALGLFVLTLSCAFAALWIRSYSIVDSSWTNHPYASFMSVRGLIIVNVTDNPLVNRVPYWDLVHHFSSDPLSLDNGETWWEKDATLGFHRVEVLRGRMWYSVPHWAPLALGVTSGMALLLRSARRFSLLALLLVSTAVSVILGVGVSLARQIN